jgi:hypothetical protein
LEEAAHAGLTRRQLQGASWRRLGGGLYVWAGCADTPELMLAAIRRRLPAEAVFSGRTAAWLHGLDVPPCDPVQVTLPVACGVSARSWTSVRRARLGGEDVVVRRGMPATSAARTVADLAGELPLIEAVVIADMALQRGLLDLARLRGRLTCQAGRKGSLRLRRVIDLSEPAAESPMETRLRLLLVLAGLPRPEAQVRLHDESGRFLARPDLYYRVERLCLEYDGATHRDSLIEDNRRQNRLQNAGFRLLRFTAADVLRAPDSVVGQVRSALALAARRR